MRRRCAAVVQGCDIHTAGRRRVRLEHDAHRFCQLNDDVAVLIQRVDGWRIRQVDGRGGRYFRWRSLVGLGLRSSGGSLRPPLGDERQQGLHLPFLSGTTRIRLRRGDLLLDACEGRGLRQTSHRGGFVCSRLGLCGRVWRRSASHHRVGLVVIVVLVLLRSGHAGPIGLGLGGGHLPTAVRAETHLVGFFACGLQHLPKMAIDEEIPGRGQLDVAHGATPALVHQVRLEVEALQVLAHAAPRRRLDALDGNRANQANAGDVGVAIATQRSQEVDRGLFAGDIVLHTHLLEQALRGKALFDRLLALFLVPNSIFLLRSARHELLPDGLASLRPPVFPGVSLWRRRGGVAAHVQTLPRLRNHRRRVGRGTLRQLH
mmetsp:Transcript_105473/g.303303  ORF Transcript_105473/g.303303 Transcript_105473/m.303303 type:complete len:374 (-) Transcript_105473:226-1347(-)